MTNTPRNYDVQPRYRVHQLGHRYFSVRDHLSEIDVAVTADTADARQRADGLADGLNTGRLVYVLGGRPSGGNTSRIVPASEQPQ